LNKQSVAQIADDALLGIADDTRHAKALPRAAPATHQRYLSIDILRAIAILLMIQVHFTDDMSYAFAPTPGRLFDASGWLGLIPAPFFTVLSGLSYALWLRAQKRSGKGDIVKYSFRRGMFVFGIGIAVNVLIWLPAATFNWDILTFLGAAALILIVVRNWRPATLAAICIVILLVTPPLRDLSHYQSYWVDEVFQYDFTLSDVVLGFLLNGYFPLLPWLIYPLAGFALGQFFDSEDDEEPSLPTFVPVLGTAMIAIALLGVVLNAYVPAWAARYYANFFPDEFYPATTVFVLLSLGGTMICLWLTNLLFDLNERVTGSGAVLSFFRRYSYFALTAYVVHLALHAWPMWIAAIWQQKTSTLFYSGRLVSTSTALLLALGFIILFYGFLVWLERHRKYSLEYFMRWCCD
jgi:uncharacterized membrane protein